MLDILLGSEYASIIRFISFLDAILLYFFSHEERQNIREAEHLLGF